MLRTNEHGFAVMNKELDAYSLEDINLETCKKYCKNGYVIAKRTPYVAGFSLRVMWYRWHKVIDFKYSIKNVLWIHWNTYKEYLHKTGEVVYTSENSDINTN